MNELGFDGLITQLREHYLQPLTAVLFHEWGGDNLDSHKAFTVQYNVDQDRDLACHYDNAEVTLNVSLGKDFEEGGIYFGPMRTEVPSSAKQVNYIKYAHQVGHAVLHRGQHMHGALPIVDGERHNLIIWMRSSKIRNEKCPMCDKPPDVVPVDDMGDGFTMKTVNVCNLA